MKKELEIFGLQKVNEIVTSLIFLGYSTQLRNLAYQVQYIDFLAKVWNSYRLYGSISSLFLKDYTVQVATAIENLLYIGVNQIHAQAGLGLARDKFESLIKLATKYLILDSKQRGEVNRLRERRNILHPKKQFELDIKVFTIEQARSDRLLMTKIIQSLKKRIWTPHLLPDCVRCDYSRTQNLSYCEICLRPLDEE